MDLHRVRREARMSQTELAVRAGISRPRLSAAENGYIRLTEAELMRVRTVVAAEPQRRATRIRQALNDPAAIVAQKIVRELSV
jgi:transcriptional regulator with XRE-family HTH domain